MHTIDSVRTPPPLVTAVYQSRSRSRFISVMADQNFCLSYGCPLSASPSQLLSSDFTFSLSLLPPSLISLFLFFGPFCPAFSSHATSTVQSFSPPPSAHSNSPPPPYSGELQMQKLVSSPVLKTQSSKVLPFKPGVGQNIALHAWISSFLKSTILVQSPSFF